MPGLENAAVPYRQEIEELMWWHSKADGASTRADGKDTVETAGAVVPASFAEMCNNAAIPVYQHLRDAPSDTSDLKPRVQALLKLATGNPDLHQV